MGNEAIARVPSRGKLSDISKFSLTTARRGDIEEHQNQQKPASY